MSNLIPSSNINNTNNFCLTKAIKKITSWFLGCPYVSFHLRPCGHDCIFTSEPNEAFCTGKPFLSYRMVHAGGGIGGVFARLTRDSNFNLEINWIFKKWWLYTVY